MADATGSSRARFGDDLQSLISRAWPQARPFLLTWGVQLGLFLAAGIYFVLYGRVNLDEGWYLYAAGQVFDGELPYVDFAYFQGPLLPYVYGIGQKLWGVGLLTGRTTSLVLNLIAFTLALRIAQEASGKPARWILAIAIVSYPLLLWTLTTTRSESLTTPLIVVAAYYLTRKPVHFHHELLALTALALASAVRVTFVVPTFGLLIYLIWIHRRSLLNVSILLEIAAVYAFLFYGLLLMVDADATWFNIVTAQLERGSRLGDIPAVSGDVLGRLHIAGLRTALISFLPAILGLIGGAIFLFGHGKRTGPKNKERHHQVMVVLVGLAVLSAAPNLAALPNFEVYYIPSMFLLAIAGAIATAQMLEEPATRPIAGGLLATVALIQLLNFYNGYPGSLSAPTSQLPTLKDAAEVVQEFSPPEGELFTLDTYLAIEADRRLSPGLSMSIFSYYPRLDEEEAADRHLLSETAWKRAFMEGDADVVALTDSSINLLINRVHTHTSFVPLSEKRLFELVPWLRQQYRLVGTISEFGQLNDSLYVLARADQLAGIDLPPLPRGSGVLANQLAAIQSYDRGLALAEEAQWSLAVDQYSRAIEFEPDLGLAYVARGEAHREQGEFELALADYTTAIDLEASLDIAYHGRGLGYIELGDNDSAIADLTQALARTQTPSRIAEIEQLLAELTGG